MLTEKQKFLNWLECQKKDHGLVGIRIVTADDPLGPGVLGPDTTEETYRDLNKLNATIARGETRPLTDSDF